jgi:hypothetical protein
VGTTPAIEDTPVAETCSVEESNTPFQMVDPCKKHNSLSADNIEQINRTAYIKGTTGDFVKEVAIKYARQFKEALAELIGEPEKITVRKDSLQILCTDRVVK